MKKVPQLLADIKALDEKNIDACRLPNNVYYLNETDILCRERSKGQSRHPYDMDGLNLWAHSSGHISSNESNLVIFRVPYSGDAPSVEFWGGIKNQDSWMPISITGVTRSMFEPVSVTRHVVYTPRAAYYIAETEAYIFAVKTYVTRDKKIHFTTSAINKTDDNAELYIAAYIDPILRYTNDDNEWEPYMRIGHMYEDASCKITRFSNPEEHDLTNIGIFKSAVLSGRAYTIEKTVSKSVFMGRDGGNVHNAAALVRGAFEKELFTVNTVDVAIYGTITKFSLPAGEEFAADYSLRVTHDDAGAAELLNERIDYGAIKADLAQQEKESSQKLSGFDIRFGQLKNEKLNHVLFNKFLKSVRRQVSLCAFGKNYAANLLGMRDVYQQLHAALLWNKEDARRKMLLALNFIMINGRVPRQISIPDVEGTIPEFDIRLYIDQGFWVVETFYKYLGVTGDYSILDEPCSYYEIIDEKKAQYKKSAVIDSALEHLIKITEFLLSNIDERTGCLKIMYGDWNDAVCGLGKTKDDAEFGTGVSIMASLQLYKTLKEMIEILSACGGYREACERFGKMREDLAEALEKHAFQMDGERTHILHGWGDKGLYNVGSLCDTDGKKRYSLNPYSFWCISEMIERKPELKESILQAYDVLDSRFGLKTFEPYFPRDMEGVGRITTLTRGTAENACAYVHATTFAIMALFILGESERAWEQIYKIIPITHTSVSKTPFVMPNSYCDNEELNINGESLGDWYTGSGAVLTRCIFEYGMGIRAGLSGLMVMAPRYMPADGITMSFEMKQKRIRVTYENRHKGERAYYINGVLQKTQTDSVSKNAYLFIANDDLHDDMEIKITD